MKSKTDIMYVRTYVIQYVVVCDTVCSSIVLNDIIAQGKGNKVTEIELTL